MKSTDGHGRTPTDTDLRKVKVEVEVKKEAEREAEWSVRGEELRSRLYDHYAKLHADWIALRKAGKTDQRFKDYVVSEDVRDARERHPSWPAAALDGIGEMTKIWMEAWYG